LPSSKLQFFASLVTVKQAVMVSLAGAFLVACLTASSVFAAGETIEVIETGQKVDFPGNVDLSLTAKGDVDIVEVRLFYRTVGSRVWAYAYPDFVPSNQITANLNLTGEVSTYLPPGTEVEYYYEIRDSQNNVLRTETAVVEYSDTRFDWEETKVGPLTLLYYDQPESRVRSVTQRLESDLERLQRLLQIESADEIKGVIYAKRADTLAAFPQQSRTTTEQQVFQGFAFPEKSVFLGLGMERGLIVHESAHLLFDQAMGDNALPTPSWLDEGFASYMDPSSTVFNGETLDPITNSLRSMSTLTGTPHAITTFYQKSLSVVAFLIGEFGETNFQQFVAQLGTGNTVDASLTAVYGFDIDGLDARWAGEAPGATAPVPSVPSSSSGSSAPGSSRPSPFLFFDAWLLGGMVLLVLAAVSIQFVASKLRPAGDPEEGLQPWEDPDLWDDDFDDEEDDGSSFR